MGVGGRTDAGDGEVVSKAVVVVMLGGMRDFGRQGSSTKLASKRVARVRLRQ